MSDRFDVYKAVLEDTGRFQQRFDSTVNTNRALILSALGGAVSGASGIVTSAIIIGPRALFDTSNGPLWITTLTTIALCIFGVFFSKYLGQYVRRSLEVLRVRDEWLKRAEEAPELTAIGADLCNGSGRLAEQA
jgi:hypothetical protein